RMITTDSHLPAGLFHNQRVATAYPQRAHGEFRAALPAFNTASACEGYPQLWVGVGRRSEREFGLAREAGQRLGACVERRTRIEQLALTTPHLRLAERRVARHGDEPPAVLQLREQGVGDLLRRSIEQNGVEGSMRWGSALERALQQQGVAGAELLQDLPGAGRKRPVPLDSDHGLGKSRQHS